MVCSLTCISASQLLTQDQTGRKALSPAGLRALTTQTTTATPDAVAEGAIPPTPKPPANSLIAKVSRPTQQQWSAIPKPDRDIATIPTEFNTFNRLQNRTRSLGSRVELRHDPDHLLKNPPDEASLEMLMANQAHMGHSTALWNPSNSRYIHGVREGIHIISLEQTAAELRRASRVVEEVAYYGGIILFVGTRPGQMPIVVRAAELAGGYHLFSKWTPGTITNRDQILGPMQLKIVDEMDQPVEGFDKHLLDRRPVVPDLVVCLNPLENWPMLRECAQENIPTIGVIDTNADPASVTYTIPANDDSLRTATVIAGVLGKAGQRGQARRLKDAALGEVTWRNPVEISKFLEIQAMIKHAEDEAARLNAEGAEQDRANKKIHGVMDAEELEAFKLLQDLERERRSKGGRRRGDE
ncbi:ribosomal protein S2 [Coniochaeta sp. 2T2.1]|nr:ribosomal protein S2 [Coniochaeta sp. 2T2.1]